MSILLAIEGAKIKLEPDASWAWKGFDGEISSKGSQSRLCVDKKPVLIKTDIIKTHNLSKNYSTKTHSTPGTIQTVSLLVDDKTLSTQVFSKAACVTEKTSGTFKAVVTQPALTPNGVPDPLLSKSGQWHIVESGQEILAVEATAPQSVFLEAPKEQVETQAKTLENVKNFQRDHELKADGIVGASTCRALENVEEVDIPDDDTKSSHQDSVLKGFRGNLEWVHAREGHNGKPYWPGGVSGITFDPGMDLGHAKASLIEQLYKPLLTAEQMAAAQDVLGIKGEHAKKVLAKSPVVKSIRISRSQAAGIFPYAAKPYWDGIVKNFPTLLDEETLASVQTVMLSLSYNRGANNKGLRSLRGAIEEKNWSKVADLIGSMQQDHRLAGIRKRRRMEADYIRKELASY